jgi:hypothetical protein
MHPLAQNNHRSGACGMKNGDRVIYTIDGRRGVADEFLWIHLIPDSPVKDR